MLVTALETVLVAALETVLVTALETVCGLVLIDTQSGSIGEPGNAVRDV